MDAANTPTPDPASGASVPPAPTPASRKGLWIALAVVAGALAVAGIWRYTSSVEVPRVIGLSQSDAVQQLEDSGLGAGPISEEETLAAEPGTVVSQAPPAGASAAKGSSVRLTVATVPSTDVPDVVGMPQSEAEAELAAVGLRLGEVTGEYSESEKAGTVLSQSPEAGMDVSVGTQVSLVISLGVETGAVPDVVGLLSDDAADVLETAGFAVTQKKTTSESVEAGLVMTQSPTAGTMAEQGATVTITVSTGAPAAEPAQEETAPPAQDEAGQPESETSEDAAQTPDEPSTEQPPASDAEKPDAQPEEPTEPQPEPQPEVVAVPDVVGMGVFDAWRELRDAEFGVEIAWGPTEKDFLTVIEQDPAAQTEVDPGTTVTITIGLPEFLFGEVEVQPLPSEEPSEESTPSEETTPSEPTSSAP